MFALQVVLDPSPFPSILQPLQGDSWWRGAPALVTVAINIYSFDDMN